jgi:hypothetical protein
VIDVVDEGYDLAIRITRDPDHPRSRFDAGHAHAHRPGYREPVLFFLWMVFFVVQTTDDPITRVASASPPEIERCA